MKLRNTARRCALEQLEPRHVFTSVLYLDFGDHFDAERLNLSVDQLRNDFGDATPGIQGPSVLGAGTPALTGANNLRLDSLAALITFDYDGSGTVDAADYTTLRTAVVDLLTSYFAPFDVTVQIAPVLDNTSTDTYLTGIRNQLQMGLAVDGERDAWVFITGAVRTDTVASLGSDIGALGLAPGNDVGGNNSRDDTALVFADTILANIIAGSLPAAQADTRLAYVAAHEAAHTFGLEHTSVATAADRQLADSDAVSQIASENNLLNFNFFTRFPLNTQVPPPAQVNNYDRLSDTNNLGLKAGAAAYVTGTGANDIIEIAPFLGTLATVTVTPFTNDDFTGQLDVPGQAAGTPLVYLIDTTNGILVEGGFGRDRFIVDAALGVSLEIRGQGGFADELIVEGGGAPTATYTPGSVIDTGLDDHDYFTGAVVIGATTINFVEFGNGVSGSSVTLADVVAVTFVSPNGADDVALALNNVGGNIHRLSGTSGGVAFVDLLLDGVQNFTLDVTTNDVPMSQNDVVRVSSNGLAVADLLALPINTGNGDDTLIVDLSTGLVRFEIDYDGGISADDNDKLVITGNPGTAIARETYLVGATQDAGTWILDADGNMGAGANVAANGDELIVNFTNLEPVDTDVPVAVFDVIFTVGVDTATIVDGGLLNAANSLQVTDVGGTFETFRFANKTTVRLMAGSAADVIAADYTTSAAGLTMLDVFGHLAADLPVPPFAADDNAADVLSVLRNGMGVVHRLHGQGGSDVFTVGNGDLSLILSAVTIVSGDGADDSLTIDDDGRNAVVDYGIGKTNVSICDDLGVKMSLVNFSSLLDRLRLDATDGTNRFDVTPNAFTEITIDANLPSVGSFPGDWLSVRFAGTTGRTLTYDNATGNGMWEFTNREDIKFESIERLNFAPVLAVAADAGKNGKPTVKVFDAETKVLLSTFLAYETSYREGVRVAVADVTGDGLPDVITAPGYNRAPQIRIFDALTGVQHAGTAFNAYASSFRGGVHLATGDVDSDGLVDVVVAPSRGAVEVRAFLNQSDTATKPFLAGTFNKFLAYDRSFIGGATVAVGDVGGNSAAEIIVGAGSGMRAEVRIFKGTTNGSVNTPASFLGRIRPFDAKMRGGVFVAVANLDADAKFEIVIGAGFGGGSRVETYNFSNLNVPLKGLLVHNPGSGFHAPLRVAAADVTGDGRAELFIAQGPDGQSHRIKRASPAGTIVNFLLENDPEFLNGIFLASNGGGDVFVC